MRTIASGIPLSDALASSGFAGCSRPPCGSDSPPAPLEIDIRDASGLLVYVATRHEAQILNHFSAIDGIATKHSLQYLRLRMPWPQARARMRRMLCSTARVVSEASQLTVKQRVEGGVVYSHFTRRARNYAPFLRQDTPTYASLRAGRTL